MEFRQVGIFFNRKYTCTHVVLNLYSNAFFRDKRVLQGYAGVNFEKKYNDSL
jgi:hypothetical protein